MKKETIKNYQKIWRTKLFQIKDVLLDVKNIRLDDELATQDAVINDLFINERAMDVLESIVDIGFFPDEPPVVVYENKQYVVIDGNRRIVSLKAMLSPNLAPSQFIKKIEKLMEGKKPIESIEMRVATSREDADKYLAAKHTKNTRRPWSTLRRAYFYYAQKEKGKTIEKMIERYRGVDIPKYIKMYEMHHIAMSLDNITDNTRQSIANRRTFDISTLERFYNDEYVRDWMNIEFDKDTGEVMVPKTASFDKVYSRVISDIVNKKATSRTYLKTKSTRKKYIENIIGEILQGKKIAKTGSAPASKFKEKKIKSPKTKKLIDAKIINTLDSYGIDEVLRELKSINYTIFPNATADMLRTFLEKVLRKYLEKMTETPSPGRNGFVGFESILNKSISVIKIDNVGKSQLLQFLKDNEKEYLDAINHNPDFYADSAYVEKVWKRMEEIIKYIFSKFE